MIVTIQSGGGVIADEVPQELPDGAWTSAGNVRFKDGYAQRFSGHTSTFTTPPAAAYHVANYPIAAGNFWIHSGLASTYADNGTTQTDITGTSLTGTADNRFTSCVLGGVYVQNNQADVPSFWAGDTGTNLATVTGWNSAWRCKSLRSFKQYLLALNVTKSTTNFGSMVKWSGAADPGSLPTTWDEADATNDAGEVDLSETPDSIVDGLALGDTFLVYKERSIYGMQATGGNEIFRIFRVPGDHGALAQNCVAEFPGGHCVLTASDVVVHNGTSPQSILNGRMRRYLFGDIDPTNFRRSFLVANHAQQEIWVCYPAIGETTCTKALVWNYQGNTFGVRDLPNATAAAFGPLSVSASDTWDADSDVWDDDTSLWDQVDVSQADKRLLMASTAPALYLMDQSGNFSGTAYTATLQRTGMHFGSPSMVKTVRSVYPRIDGPTGTTVSIQVGAANDPETSPVWSPAVTYTIGSTYKADIFATGRFLSLRISGVRGSWRFKSLDMDIVERGMY